MCMCGEDILGVKVQKVIMENKRKKPWKTSAWSLDCGWRNQLMNGVRESCPHHSGRKQAVSSQAHGNPN